MASEREAARDDCDCELSPSDVHKRPAHAGICFALQKCVYSHRVRVKDGTGIRRRFVR